MNFLTNKKKKNQDQTPPNSGISSSIAQFYIFLGEKYIGWDCFDQTRVSVGRGQEADLVIPDDDISPVQAVFVIKGGRVLVSDEGRKGVLKVNDKPASDCIIGPFDFVRIGEYTLKIKLKNVENESLIGSPDSRVQGGVSESVSFQDGGREDRVKSEPDDETEFSEQEDKRIAPEPVQENVQENERAAYTSEVKAETPQFRLVFESKLFDGYTRVEVKKRLGAALNISDKRLSYLFSGNRVIVKKNSDFIALVKLKEVFEKAGALCEIEDIASVPHHEKAQQPVTTPEPTNEQTVNSDHPEEAEVESILQKLLNDTAQTNSNEDTIVSTISDSADEDRIVSKTKQSSADDVADLCEPVLALADFDDEPQHLEPRTEDSAGSFPPGFYSNTVDEEDMEEEDDDVDVPYLLREKLTGGERNIGRSLSNEKVLEVIRMRQDDVKDVLHLKNGDNARILNDGKQFCDVKRDEKNGSALVFSGEVNRLFTENTDKALYEKLNIQKDVSLKSKMSRQEIYKAILPDKGEVMVSDGFYDYLIRTSFLQPSPVVSSGKGQQEQSAFKRAVNSTAFRWASKSIAAHIVLLLVLSLSITFPDTEEFKKPLTYFVVVDTKNIHKPVKPKPKPKRVVSKSKPAPKKTKKTAVKKQSERKVASVRPKKISEPNKSPKAGGGHKGNLKNRNINETGLLGSLGMKTGISIKSNKALASVTNIDAVTSTHSDEGRLKVGGLVGNLGDKGITIPKGEALNTKGSTNVLRSAGIGGDGNVAALSAGKTGNRDVAGGVVSAPLTKRVKFRGGGISREAVAKVINAHIDEINYCYESALISDPSLMGKVVFEWKILLDGSVGEIRISSSTVRSDAIHSCIKAAIRTWTFPKPKGAAVVVSYPFVFDVTGF